MLPVQKPTHTYRTLEEIRQRKDELTDELQKDNVKFSTLWNQVFVSKDETSRGEYIASLVSKGFVSEEVEEETQIIIFLSLARRMPAGFLLAVFY